MNGIKWTEWTWEKKARACELLFKGLNELMVVKIVFSMYTTTTKIAWIFVVCKFTQRGKIKVNRVGEQNKQTQTGSQCVLFVEIKNENKWKIHGNM